MKKLIELSVLCDLEIFMYVYDKTQNRVTHYASNEDFDMLALFNNKAQREFFSNFDYDRVGGSSSEIDSKYVQSRKSEELEDSLDIEAEEMELAEAGMSSLGGGISRVTRNTQQLEKNVSSNNQPQKKK